MCLGFPPNRTPATIPLIRLRDGHELLEVEHVLQKEGLEDDLTVERLDRVRFENLRLQPVELGGVLAHDPAAGLGA